MKVVIASETSSYELKEAVKKHLVELGYEVLDVGAQSASDGTLYFQSASALARVIQRGEAERGIVMCGTGGGASLICNAFKGVYCVACESVFTAEKIGLINNANVLAMGRKWSPRRSAVRWRKNTLPENGARALKRSAA